MDKLTAGRSLDALVAEKVMELRVRFERGEECGWQNDKPIMWTPNDYIVILEDGTPERVTYLHAGLHNYHLVPHYSTDIKDACAVVKQMFRQPEEVYDRFLLELTTHCPKSNDTPDKVMGWFLSISNKPEMICRAALIAREQQGRDS